MVELDGQRNESRTGGQGWGGGGGRVGASFLGVGGGKFGGRELLREADSGWGIDA